MKLATNKCQHGVTLTDLIIIFHYDTSVFICDCGDGQERKKTIENTSHL